MAKKHDIYAIIAEAFEGITLEDGVSLRQAEVIDRYGEGLSGGEFADLTINEVTHNWQQIPAATLDQFECLAHLDAKGFRYYIPAFMLRLIEKYDSASMKDIGTLSGLYPKKESWEYHTGRYSLLNEAQSIAIALYLVALPDLVELDYEDKTIVSRALANFWSKYLPPNVEGA